MRQYPDLKLTFKAYANLLHVIFIFYLTPTSNRNASPGSYVDFALISPQSTYAIMSIDFDSAALQTQHDEEEYDQEDYAREQEVHTYFWKHHDGDRIICTFDFLSVFVPLNFCCCLGNIWGVFDEYYKHHPLHRQACFVNSHASNLLHYDLVLLLAHGKLLPSVSYWKHLWQVVYLLSLYFGCLVSVLDSTCTWIEQAWRNLCWMSFQWAGKTIRRIGRKDISHEVDFVWV